MRIAAVIIVIAFVFFSCKGEQSPPVSDLSSGMLVRAIGDIPVTKGMERAEAHNHFSKWLRSLPLRSTNKVYLYNKALKADQSKHYAVIDVSTGSKDLQQCADAIMRLRAEFFFEQGKYDSIRFYSAGNKELSFSEYMKGHRYFLAGNRLQTSVNTHAFCDTRKCFMQSLETVFAYCGTYNLFDQLKHRRIQDMQAGDVLIKPGSPGHAMIVVDMAQNKATGKKFFMLAQGYMPAQDMHIVLNPKETNSPWFELDTEEPIVTPYWVFTPGQLKGWN